MFSEYETRIMFYFSVDFKDFVEAQSEGLELDLMFETCDRLTKEFKASKWDNSDYPLYVCLQDFVKNYNQKAIQS